MAHKVGVCLHFWPWSMGVAHETIDIQSEQAEYQFWGSPVLSIHEDAIVFIPQRHEQLKPMGPVFDTLGGKHRLFEIPHGTDHAMNGNGYKDTRDFSILFQKKTNLIRLFPKGAKFSKNDETQLTSVVLAWSQFFDDLIDKTGKTKREGRMPWSVIGEMIYALSKDMTEPRMSLIVEIADKLKNQITFITKAARKILVRERQLIHAARIQETDTNCMKWLIRQPGENVAQKAATNRQRLMGITRKESFNTLENRVLKDFLRLCEQEGNRYINTEIGDDPGYQLSSRYQSVKSFSHLCNELKKIPAFNTVSKPPSFFQPNYVLQNDYRYRRIWQHYLRLLKREDEEDRLWDWQARTWADVTRFLVCAALYKMSIQRSEAQGIHFKEFLSSAVHLRKEQNMGCRIYAGSEPGPFVVTQISSGQMAVLEVVHSEKAHDHPSTKLLGRMGGHLYLVLSPLDGGTKTVFLVWAVHTAAAKKHPEWEKIRESAETAIAHHRIILNEFRDSDLPRLKGFVLASDTDSKNADLYPGESGETHLVQVTTEQRCWEDALLSIGMILEELLVEVL